MGGAAITALVRAGVEHLAIADPDRFELSNLNRQLFATLETVGKRKVEAVRRAVGTINPGVEIESFGGEWVDQVDELLTRYPLVINAMDDVAAGIRLYRAARAAGATVIDAYTSPLPSVTVVRAGAPLPEERLAYPTVGRPGHRDDGRGRRGVRAVRDRVRARQFLVGALLRSRDGARSALRPAAAPVLRTDGDHERQSDVLRGGEAPVGARRSDRCARIFFDPWRGVVERPRGAVSAFAVRLAVRRRLRELAS